VITLKFNDVVSSLLSEKLRRKIMDNQSTYSLSIIGRTLDTNTNKSYSGKSKSLGKSLKKCWKCGKVGNFKKDFRSKSIERGKGSDDAPSTKGKSSLEEGGDVYLASS
jgi:hypothetical protein